MYLEGGGENGGQLFLGFETNKDGVQYLTKKTPWDGLFVFFGAVSGVVSIIWVGFGLFYKNKNATEPELVLSG